MSRNGSGNQQVDAMHLWGAYNSEYADARRLRAEKPSSYPLLDDSFFIFCQIALIQLFEQVIRPAERLGSRKA